MAKKIDYIQVPFGTVPKIMALFGCSKGTVYRALKYDSSTELGNRIREAALQQFHGVASKKTIFV